jgi:hypothetical protein
MSTYPYLRRLDFTNDPYAPNSERESEGQLTGWQQDPIVLLEGEHEG